MKKNMEIIKNIKEVSDVYFNNDKWNTYDGYCIETDSRQLYFVINNGQDCCENWGYLSSEDDFGSFIGSELKNVYVTDTKLGTIVSKPAWPGFFDGLKTGYQSAADRLDTMSVVEERKHGHWEDIDLDTSVCSVCKKPQEYETKYCPECGAKEEE